LEKTVSREEIIAAVKECAAKLERTPSEADIRVTMSVKRHWIRKYFITYTQLLSACGLERHGSGVPLTMEAIFLDWARVVRSTEKIPTVAEYDLRGIYSSRPFLNRFKSWRNVPEEMLAHAVAKGKSEEWEDVLKIIAQHLKLPAEEAARFKLPSGPTFRPRLMEGRPIYGQPLWQGPLTFAPTNEAGVLAAFAVMARDLGFVIQRVQAEFPDCEAIREVDKNKWQPSRIEFEYMSRNFVEHQHPVSGADAIVCWFDNWPECPLEVIELSSVIANWQNRQNCPNCRDRKA
jgi:Homing endonuclease associated repeat